MVRIKGQVTIVDLTDSRQLVAYISSSNRRQVIYDPNTQTYFPNYGDTPNILHPELYIAGGGSNIISQAKSVQWSVQTDSIGSFSAVSGSSYEVGEGYTLKIKENVLEEHLSMLYRVEIVYHDPDLAKDILIQADLEIVKLSNGTKGEDGEYGLSAYELWLQDGNYTEMLIDNRFPDVTDPEEQHYMWGEGSKGSTPQITYNDKVLSLSITELEEGEERFYYDKLTVNAYPSNVLYPWGSDNFNIPDGHKAYLHVESRSTRAHRIAFSLHWDFFIDPWTDKLDFVDSTLSTPNEWHQTSGVIEVIEDEMQMQVGITELTQSGFQIGDTLELRNITVIDLTDNFGPGNEPTKEEMDDIMESLGREIIIEAPIEVPKSKEEYLDSMRGRQGIQGPKGEDGESSYTHVAYAMSDSGDGFSHSSFEDAEYIGIYVDDKIDSSDDWQSYEWTLIKGKDGTQGLPGPKGDDGQTPYFHTAWANNSTGTSGFSATNSTDKLYIGTYTDFEQDSSNDPAKYSWTKIKGDKGEDGEDGKDAVLLIIETPEGTTVRNSEGTLSAVAEIFSGTTLVTPTSYQWYKRRPGTTGDSDSGPGWQVLSSTTNFGTTGYTTDTLVIPPEAITGNATYMVIVDYEGTKFRRQVSVYDITDPFMVVPMGDQFFRNGQGTNTYTARVYRNGEEIDHDGDEGLIYLWHQYSSTGQKVVGFERTGKVISLDSADFSGKAQLQVTVGR